MLSLMEATPIPTTLRIVTSDHDDMTIMSSGHDNLEGPFHVPVVFVLTQHLCFCCPVFLSPSALPNGLSSAICPHFQCEVLIYKQVMLYGVN